MVWSTRYSRCVYLALSTLDVVIKDYYFEVNPRLRVPRFSLLCAPWQKTRPNSKRRPFTSFCFIRFFKCVILFPCFVPRGKRVRSPRALMPAVRGSLRRRSRLSHPAVRGTSCRRSRLSDPAVRGSWRRRSRLCHPAVRGSSRRRLRINQPSVHWRWLHHPRLTLARRPASDSMPAGLPLIPARQECRWLKLAGLPLTQARRIAADSCNWSSAGKANSPLSVSRRRPRPTSVSRASSTRGKPTRRPRFTRPAAGWGSLQPAGPCRCVVKPAGCCHYLSSQPIMVSPDGRCRIDKPAGRGRIWPDSDHGLFNCLCVFSPGGLLIPLSFPRKFWGGVVGLRPKRLRWGLGPRSLRRSRHGLPSSLLRHGLPSSQLRHGLPSSLLHLDLGLSVPLWRPRPVYVSVSVLWGLQSAHPPSLVVLLRHGTCLPGGGSYVRDLSCASCGSRLLFLYLVCFLSVVIIVYSCHLLC